MGSEESREGTLVMAATVGIDSLQTRSKYSHWISIAPGSIVTEAVVA
jgi:hypothetical protein